MPRAPKSVMLLREIDPSYLGRIAAKTAEQAIKQRLRQFEKEHIYDEFRDQVGSLNVRKLDY